jgi:hypothetical protein
VVKQQTAGDRFRHALRRVADWCQHYRHTAVREQWVALKQKLLGHYGYFGVTGNYRALQRFLTTVSVLLTASIVQVVD